MFISPRFVVVDDRPDHLNAILNVFEQLRSPCLGIVYDASQELDRQSFENVRALFLDLHLSDLAATTDETRHYAVIANILEDNINPIGGPFVLVIWTEHEQSAANLVAYLDASLDPEKPYARPLAIANLPKDQFIDIGTGSLLADRADDLKRAVERAVERIPQLAALVTWETQIQRAAGATLSALMELVPEDQRDTAAFAEGLNEILTRLAQGAVGRQNVAANPHAAITGALTPLLADRLVNQQPLGADLAIWTDALTWNGQNQLDDMRVGKINRMLQAAVPPSEAIQSTDWGAVVDFPDGWWNNAGLRARFDVTLGQLLGSEFKIGRNDRDNCRPRLIRVGAVCDYAQNRSGPIPYLFGLEIPCDVQRIQDDTGTVRPPASEWCSPVLCLDTDGGPFVLAINSRYSLSVVQAEAQNWQPRYRLREPLLMQLTSHASNYLARPGIVQL